MNDHTTKPARTGRGGALLVVLLACLSSGFWIYQGTLRRHRHEWIAQVKSLGLTAAIMSNAKWSSQMFVPGPTQIVDRDFVIVMVDSESEGQALLKAPATCPHDTKIYAFDGLSRTGYMRLEERFPTAVVFTRITQ